MKETEDGNPHIEHHAPGTGSRQARYLELKGAAVGGSGQEMERPAKMEMRYELRELVDPGELRSLVQSFCKSLSVSGGVVRNPEPGEELPNDRTRFSDWRLTPVIGFDRKGIKVDGGSRFCCAIRALDYGDKMCLVGDLGHAKTAFENHDAEPYVCPSMGLCDVVGPIRVGGHHLANVYFGQLRPKDLAFDPTTWYRYQGLKKESTNAYVDVSHDDLESYFQELRTVDETIGIDAIKDLLKHLADLISRKASREAGIKVIGEMASEIVSCFDLKQGLQIVLEKISRAINFDSATIWIAEGDKLVPKAAIRWDPRPILIKEAGIAALVFRKGEPIKCDNREEVDKYGPPGNPNSRDLRGIQSYLGAPLLLDNRSVGVISVVSRNPRLYTPDDKKLIDLLARYAALYVKSNRETNMLLGIAREKTWQNLLDRVVNSAPALVNGWGCSIFLRPLYRFTLPDKDITTRGLRGLPAILVATTELPVRLIGEASYKPDRKEGLTAGVLALGKPIKIPGGKGARTEQLKTTHPGWVWKCRYPSEDEIRTGSKYFEDRPFLAAPIKNSAGLVLGVIRIADAAEGKDRFSDSDLAILTACATELGSALEASSIGFFFAKITDGVRAMEEKIADLGERVGRMNGDFVGLHASVLDATAKKVILPRSTFAMWALGAVAPALVVTCIIVLLLYTQWRYRIEAILSFLVSSTMLCCLWMRSPAQARGGNAGKQLTVGKLQPGKPSL